MISNSLPPQRKLRYYGVDMSAGALECARRNLAGFQGEISLIRNDFLRELAQMTDTFDVIVCGYTLHHLPSEDKQRFLQLVSQRLTADGVFIFYDVETNDAETRDAYLQRACQTMRQTWGKLSSARMDSVIAHVQNNDLPESSAFHQQAFRECGFKYVEKPFRDPHGLFSLYLLGTDALLGRNPSRSPLIRGGEGMTVPWNGRGWEWRQVAKG